jgi:hypothetical protein
VPAAPTATQVAEGYSDTITAIDATRTYLVRDKTPAELAADEQAADDAAALAYAKADTVIRYLVTHTPAEIEAYVQTNVTNLATAKDMLAKFGVALSVIAKDRLR